MLAEVSAPQREQALAEDPSLKQPQPLRLGQLQVQSADWRKSESPGYVCAEELAIEPHGNTCPRLFVGMFVEFWSERNQYWMPTEVLNMDAETGAVRLSVRDGWLDVQEQLTRIRAVTTPTIKQVESVQAVIEEGRIAEKASSFFDRHARTDLEATAVIHREDTKVLCMDVDEFFGICGSTTTLLRWMRDQNMSCCDADSFQLFFWELVWKWKKEHLQVMQKTERAKQQPFKDCYSLERKLGSGAFGSVYKAKCRKTQEVRAVKVIEKEIFREAGKRSSFDAQSEVDIMLQLDHPHIVKLYEHYQDSEQHYLVLDFCTGGDLLRAICHSPPATEAYAVQVLAQVLVAVGHMHNHSLLHLDIKPANIMLTQQTATLPPCRRASSLGKGCLPCNQPHVMLIDLGVAELFQAGGYRGHAPKGTPTTMAPEVWKGELTPLADVFSIGCVLFQILTKETPFEPGRGSAEARAFWKGARQFKTHLLDDRSSEIQRVCNRMMHLERKQRGGVHQWMQSKILKQLAESSCGDSERSLRLEPSSRVRLETTSQIWERLMQTAARSVLQKTVALAIAARWPANQWGTVKVMFAELDVHRTGCVSVHHIASALTSHGASEKGAALAADAMDLHRDGKIEWTEFVAACIPLEHPDMWQDVRFIFDTADADGESLLRQEDIANLLPMSSSHCKDLEAKEIFLELTGRIEDGARLDWPTFYNHVCGRLTNTPRRTSISSTSSPPLQGDGESAASTCHDDSGESGRSQSTACQTDIEEDQGPFARCLSYDVEHPGFLLQALEANLVQLANLGFHDSMRCENALRMYGNDLNAAAVYLCQNDGH
mmetsp:Transcript_36433/g.83715  ORF Transcript_36433/g.83715 Transcript_36433/m.83715 type:complete len:828 (-) Transcript_36433:154-2637(-)